MATHLTMDPKDAYMPMKAPAPTRRTSLALRATSALVVGTLALQTVYTPVARAETAPPAHCNEPKKDPPFLSKEWRMGKFADFDKYLDDKTGEVGKEAASAILKTAVSGGSLQEYAMAVFGAVMDSYVPGISSLFEPKKDPAAEQTKILLDAIHGLESNLSKMEGDGWAEFRYAENRDLHAELAAIRTAISDWNRANAVQGGGFSVAAVDLLGDDIVRITDLLRTMEATILTPGSASGDAKYPYLSLLETYVEVMQLYMLNNPNFVYRLEANNNGVFKSDDFAAASSATVQTIDQDASDATLDMMSDRLKEALAFAKQVSDIDPFRERANWMAFQQPKEDYPALANCDEDTDRVRVEGNLALGVLAEPCAGLSGCHEAPIAVYSYTSNNMNPDFTTTVLHHCIVADQTWQGWWSTYDGFTTMYKTPEEAFAANKQAAYNTLLRVAWGPFSIILDKWWSALVNAGVKTGLREPLPLDRRLDNYLLDTGPGPSIDASMKVLIGISDRAPTAREASLLVNFGLEYGYEQLTRLGTEQWANDRVFFPNGHYPLDDRLRFVIQTRKPEKMTAYYQSLQAARMIPLL